MPTLVRLATRGISAIVAATVVIGGWSAVTASPASAGQAYVASYNMCVDYCHRPGTLQYRDGNAVDYAYNQIVNSPTTPWIVGLQETCTLSMWDLGNRLQSRGVVWHFFNVTTGDPKTEDCIDNFGDGILTIGGNLNNGLRYSIGDGKYMSCVYKQGYGFTWSACTLHLSAWQTSTEKQTTKNQASKAYANRNGIGSNVIVAGDFNLVPADLSPIWPTTEDVDTARIGTTSSYTAVLGKSMDTGLESKIDYVMARRSFFPNGQSGARSCDAYYSDHCYLRGWFGT